MLHRWPSRTIDLYATDLAPETGELDLKVGSRCTSDMTRAIQTTPPYALEEVCHVTAAVNGATVTFDNTSRTAGRRIPTVCRSYTPRPFKTEATKNDTLTFIIDGAPIYIGLSPGLPQTAEQFDPDMNLTLGAPA